MDRKRLYGIFKGDKGIWMIYLFLCLISIVEVYTASSQLTYRAGSNFMAPWIKHVVIMVGGLVAMLATLNVPCRYYKIINLPLVGVSIVLLAVVFIIGQSTNGAQRWIPLLGMQFQPSEIAKGSLVLWTAVILSATQTDKGADKRAMFYVLLPCLAIIPLIMSENLSTAALLCLVLVLMMFIGRVPLTQLGKLIGLGTLVVGAFLAFVMLAGTAPQQEQPTQTAYVQNADGTTVRETTQKKEGGGFMGRIGTWKGRIMRFSSNENLSPKDVDLRDKGAQAAHADIAIATSNIIGKGIGNSEECDFLSQAYSDFIYAIIIEEMGIAGAVFVALLYVFLLVRAGRIARRCENNFPALLAMGLALLIVVQALFNMCVAVGLVPVTGQPLPLVSKGGTSTIINCIYLGAILSISRTAKKKDGKTQAKQPAVATVTA